MKNIEKYLDNIGKKGSIQRLEVIASMDLGKHNVIGIGAEQIINLKKIE